MSDNKGEKMIKLTKETILSIGITKKDIDLFGIILKYAENWLKEHEPDAQKRSEIRNVIAMLNPDDC